ncbi:hypothetical protein B0I37DRAFT_156294 [Chaetomium sp. MPI-CAGE-AT-0009]|nr:hypothetical protein B0I37DRAFT_156294 [Chaetomium sp. MPI-CAGE-AT-0009]
MPRIKRFIRSFLCLPWTRSQRSRDNWNKPTTKGDEELFLSTDGISYERSIVVPDGPWKKDTQEQDSSPAVTELHLETLPCLLHAPDGRLAKDSSREQAASRSKTAPPHNPPVFTFPLEIFDMIWAYLTPPESRMAFSLTCRFFFDHYKPGLLNVDETKTLQLWLEKDIPNLYFCLLCKTLHNWCCGELRSFSRYEGRQPRRVLSFDKGCRFRKWSEHPASLGNAQHIKLETARLLINRHLYGEKHGPNLDVLSFRRHRPAAGQTTGSSIMVEESRRLRIIDDELYAEEKVLMYHKDGYEAALRDYLDAPGGEDILPPVCRHIGRYYRFGKTRPAKHTAEGFEFIGPILSCKYCYTDYHIQARLQAGDGARPAGWTVSGTKWYTLGSCRDLLNDKWNNAAIDRVPFVVRSRSAHWPAGAVHRRWAFGSGYGVGDVDRYLTRRDLSSVSVGSP